MAKTYNNRTRPVASTKFLNAADVPTAPTAVTVSTLSPAGARTDYSSPHATIVLGTTVVFTFPSPLTVAGEWTVTTTGTAGVEASHDQTFTIEPTRLP